MKLSPLDSDVSLPLLQSKRERMAAAEQIAGFARGVVTDVKKPIFVLGCPRSGTTVLGSCLAEHPMLAGARESLFLLDLWRMVYDLHGGDNHQLWNPLADYLTTDELLRAVGAFADVVIKGLMDRVGKERYVDHTPWYVACIPLIRSIYPDATVVHLLRDGRSVVASLQHSKGKFGWAGDSVAQSAELWSSLVSTGISEGRQVSSINYLEVRYEDMCQAPDRFFKLLLSELELKWDERVLQPLTVKHATPTRVQAQLATLDGSGALQLMPRCIANEWPKSWSVEERDAFRKWAGASMVAAGYWDNETNP